MDLFNHLENNQALFNAIVTSSNDAIVSKTLDGIITSWNPAAEKMFGYLQTEAVGKHISLIIPEDRLSEEDYIIGQIKAGKKVDHFETIRKTKNGQNFPISVTVSPVVDKEGNIIGASKIARDISDRHIAQQEKAELLEKLKELNIRKDEFIALASHELRTPLTSMDAYLQILKRYIDDEKVKVFLEKALAQSKKLNHLISDLLDVSKIESGKLVLRIEKFDIHQLVEDTIDLISKANEFFEITLHSEIDSIQIEGDHYKIEQVITNLLTNAIRYSAGSKQIDVFIKAENGIAIIGVKDYGAGIDSNHFEDIFSRFYQVHQSNNVSGLGLGLYLCKQIISQHWGKIWVESELKKGSTFWIELPVSQC
ncbi:PAS domain S-box protein [Epilithonimonas zeae]|uniref:histidine kinase n=1 Tax=Epilithonimonas zeae TaxID=1416779 RepID=A0A1N6FBG3_9FLAO|nr:PAS domain S-box protein [Epilithonimonas zeae]SIN92564.1 PAS domain S-box-containing protein [Epilithonimonas zeae]